MPSRVSRIRLAELCHHEGDKLGVNTVARADETGVVRVQWYLLIESPPSCIVKLAARVGRAVSNCCPFHSAGHHTLQSKPPRTFIDDKSKLPGSCHLPSLHHRMLDQSAQLPPALSPGVSCKLIVHISVLYREERYHIQESETAGLVSLTM